MLRLAAAALILVLASGGTGLADDAAPASPSHAALDALRSDPHVMKAVELEIASGSKESMLQRMDLLVDVMLDETRKTRTNIPDKVWDMMRTTMKDEFRVGADDYLLMSAKVYADHFTDAELDQLIAFYKSDVGMKYLRERPAIVREDAAIGKVWGEQMAPLVRDQMLKKLQAMSNPSTEQKT